jgi:hypothetical protein
MRISREIPPRTLIWIARIDGVHLGNFGTDFLLASPTGFEPVLPP